MWRANGSHFIGNLGWNKAGKRAHGTYGRLFGSAPSPWPSTVASRALGPTFFFSCLGSGVKRAWGDIHLTHPRHLRRRRPPGEAS